MKSVPKCPIISSGGRVDRWFRFDLNPFPGFSGGPIINADCEVLGIANSGPGRSAAVVPCFTVNRVVDQILKHGRTVRGYVGIGYNPWLFQKTPGKSSESVVAGGC